MGARDFKIPNTGSSTGTPLNPTLMGDSTLDGLLKYRLEYQPANNTSSSTGTGTTVSELLGYAQKPNPRNLPENTLTNQTRNPLPVPKIGDTIEIAAGKSAAEAAKRANTPSPSSSLTLIGVLDKASRSSESLALSVAAMLSKFDTLTNSVSEHLNDVAAAVAVSSANHQELFNSGSSVITRMQGIEDKIGLVHTQLANIADKENTVVVSSPDVTVNNSIDFDPIKTPLEEIAQSQKAYLEPSNVQINGQTIQASAAGLASMANISHIETNTLKKEALSYEAEPQSLTLVSGEPAVEISPREAKALSAAQNMKHKSDINNEKFEDDDFDLKSLIMPMLSFKGVASELDAIHGLFDTGLSTNPFNMDFNIFASYSDTKETI